VRLDNKVPWFNFTIKSIMTLSCVYVHVKPEDVGKFIEATKANHFGSVKEPGNLRFDFLQQSDDTSRFMIYEAYESEEAAAAHKNTAHYLKWRDAVKDMMAEPSQGVKYNIIEPQDRSAW
jgi:autoinducer 2-degrading protein